MTLVIGLNSGSSFDGIDVVLVENTVTLFPFNRFGILGKLVQPPRLVKL